MIDRETNDSTCDETCLGRYKLKLVFFFLLLIHIYFHWWIPIDVDARVNRFLVIFYVLPAVKILNVFEYYCVCIKILWLNNTPWNSNGLFFFLYIVCCRLYYQYIISLRFTWHRCFAYQIVLPNAMRTQ
jgi:hypothetical protein